MTTLMAVVANVQELAPCAGRRLPASQAGRFAFLPHCSSFGSDQRLSDCLEWPMGALEGDIVRRGRSGPCLVVGLAWGGCLRVLGSGGKYWIDGPYFNVQFEGDHCTASPRHCPFRGNGGGACQGVMQEGLAPECNFSLERMVAFVSLCKVSLVFM